MPKLPSEKILVDTTNDGRIVNEVSVHVDSSGRFTVGIPDAIKDSVDGFFTEGSFGYKGLELNYGRGASRGVRGALLKTCVEFVKAAVANHYAVETTVEEVLVYRYSSGLGYWKNPDGTITHNGGASDADRKGQWAGAHSAGRHGQKDEDEGLLLCAIAMVKKTHTRGSTKTVEWAIWRPKSVHDDSDIRSRLNSISPGSAPEDPTNDWIPWTVISYDEKAAEFFYRTIHSLCRIDDQLRAFFGDHQKVTAAIVAGGGLPLLT